MILTEPQKHVCTPEARVSSKDRTKTAKTVLKKVKWN